MVSALPTPPNPRLQRTRSASPPSPLSRQPLGRLSAVAGSIIAAILACSGCASVPLETSEEEAITRSALASDWTGLSAKPRRARPVEMTGPAWVLACSSPDFAKWPYASGTDINFTIPIDLLSALVAINRDPHRLSSTLLADYFEVPSEGERSYQVQVSRPAIAASGVEAVIAISVWAPEGWCDSGLVAFLSKESGSWVVKGYGCFWVT